MLLDVHPVDEGQVDGISDVGGGQDQHVGVLLDLIDFS